MSPIHICVTYNITSFSGRIKRILKILSMNFFLILWPLYLYHFLCPFNNFLTDSHPSSMQLLSCLHGRFCGLLSRREGRHVVLRRCMLVFNLRKISFGLNHELWLKTVTMHFILLFVMGPSHSYRANQTSSLIISFIFIEPNKLRVRSWYVIKKDLNPCSLIHKVFSFITQTTLWRCIFFFFFLGLCMFQRLDKRTSLSSLLIYLADKQQMRLPGGSAEIKKNKKMSMSNDNHKVQMKADLVYL